MAPCDTRRESLWRDPDGRISCWAGHGHANAIGRRLCSPNHGMKLLPRPLRILQNSHRICSTGVICHACNLLLSNSLRHSLDTLLLYCDHLPPISRKRSSPAPLHQLNSELPLTLPSALLSPFHGLPTLRSGRLELPLLGLRMCG